MIDFKPVNSSSGEFLFYKGVGDRYCSKENPFGLWWVVVLQGCKGRVIFPTNASVLWMVILQGAKGTGSEPKTSMVLEDFIL